jgi:hypothetical protein
MAFYLLTVERGGSRSYAEAATSKHQIEAQSLDDAQWRADQIAESHYRDAKATLRIFDNSGLVSTRTSDGEWTI